MYSKGENIKILISMNKQSKSVLSLAVIVASLGYFVDMYDLLLFTIVKRPSLLAVGSTDGSNFT